jgi:hypothetical protein
MVAAVGIQAPQAGTLVTFRQAAHDANVPQAGSLVAYNVPSQSLAAVQAGTSVAFREAAILTVDQAQIYAAVRGRVANPRVRAWTFTLDGHDFYVLRLGDTETLIYDMSTEQWVDWDSFDLPVWRPNTGITWVGGQALADTYGSSIIAGDDTWGLLWFLAPEQPFDDHADYLNATQQIDFERVVTGQLPNRGRGAIPCYVIFLTGDNYGITADDFAPGVTLEYSDDGGKTYDDAGTIELTVGGENQAYEWYSLGQIDAPGRLFKITDNGVFTRIDDMKMNDD